MSDVILITGGAGFIGSHLVRHFLGTEPALQVVNLDRLTYAGNLDSLAGVIDHPQHAFVMGDIADEKLVTELFDKYQPSAVVHLAAESHVDRSIDGPGAFVLTNVVGTHTLLNVARTFWSKLASDKQERFRFLQVSTDEVYGTLGPTGKFSESTPYAPRSPYAASKAAADHLVRSYFETYRLPTLVTNTCNNFGPNQFPEKLIPLMTLNAIEGKPLPVYGDGLQVRDWLFVEDHCRALRMVLEQAAPGETYNIGASCELTNLDMVERVCDLVDELRPGTKPRRELIQHVADRPGHDRRYAIDAGKIGRELGWRPKETFETGLRRTVAWYLANPRWWGDIRSGVYRGERLGAA